MIWHTLCLSLSTRGSVVNYKLRCLKIKQVYSCCFYLCIYFTVQVTIHGKIAWISVMNGVTPLTVDVVIDWNRWSGELHASTSGVSHILWLGLLIILRLKSCYEQVEHLSYKESQCACRPAETYRRIWLMVQVYNKSINSIV